MPSPRVVSLLPSATELLCAVGGRDLLVGRSHECDFPAGLERVPVLTAARTHADMTAPGASAAIDAQVREALALASGEGAAGGGGGGGGGAQSLYTLDVARLVALKPDVILTQDLCSVCSIDLHTVRAAAAMMQPRPQVVSLNPETLEAVFDDLLTVARAVDREQAGRAALVALRERLYRAQDFVNPYDDGPALAFFEWTDPVFVGGHWTPQLIERAGARHPLNPTVPVAGSGAAAGPQAGSRRAGKSVRVPAEAVGAASPARVVICPCGLDLRATRAAYEHNLRGKDWFEALPAVRAARAGGRGADTLALVDGNQFFNRPGPRLVDAFEWLVGWLHGRPELIPEGFAWAPVRGG